MALERVQAPQAVSDARGSLLQTPASDALSFEVPLPVEEGSETLAGLVYEAAGKVPEAYRAYAADWNWRAG